MDEDSEAFFQALVVVIAFMFVVGLIALAAMRV